MSAKFPSMIPAPPGGGGSPTSHPLHAITTLTIGGTPGWEITAIALGAAAMAALLAVLVTIYLFRKLAPQP